MTSHKQTCANGCTFAKKSTLLAKAGTQEDWLYRCMKIDKLITSDSVVHAVGCATYTTGSEVVTEEDRAKKAVELINQANQWLNGRPENAPKGDQPV